MAEALGKRAPFRSGLANCPKKCWLPDLFLVIGVVAIVSGINIYLHEKCHQVVFEKLTEKPAIICITRGTPNCRPTAPCSIPAYLAAQIFPLITAAMLGVITCILYIFNAPSWFIFGLAIATIYSFLGSSGDLYWTFKLRNYPTNKMNMLSLITALGRKYMHRLPKEID